MSRPGTVHGTGFDGTTGRSSHGGRRTHIIQLLRDTPEPLGVAEVAAAVGVPPGTARAHLEALVDAGMAHRTQQLRQTPGRPRVVYDGVLPDQAHARAQGYRLLSTLLVAQVAAQTAPPQGRAALHDVGVMWGRHLVESDGPGPGDDDECLRRLVARLDALWFAPELLEVCCHDTVGTVDDQQAGPPDPLHRTRRLATHHCPLRDAMPSTGDAACAVHAGLVDGALEALGSPRRLVGLTCQPAEHRCVATLGVPAPAGRPGRESARHDRGHDRASAPGRA